MPSRKDCPVLQILDVDYPNTGRKNGEILISLSEGSGQYSVTLSQKGNTGALAEKKCTDEGVYAFAGLAKGEYTLRVHDCQNVHCQPIEKVVVLGVREPLCHDKYEDPKKESPCHVEYSPNHYGDLCVQLHKVVQPTCKRLGSLAVRVSGGQAPYQITFKGPVSKTISADRSGVYGSNNLPAGEYWISVTDAAQDCETLDARLCQVTSPLLVNTSTLCNPTCSNDGSFQVNLCTGVAPFKIFVTGPVNSTRYVDTNGSRCQYFEFLPAGNYSVTVIDGEHQVEETCVYLEAVINPMKLTAYKKSDIVCNKNGVINYHIEGGHFPFIIDLLKNDVVVQSRCENAEDSKTKAAEIKGSFEVSDPCPNYQVRVRDGCCQKKTSMNIDVQEPDPGLTVSVTRTGVECGPCGPEISICVQADTTNIDTPVQCLFPLYYTLTVDCGDETNTNGKVVCESGAVFNNKFTFSNLPPNDYCVAANGDHPAPNEPTAGFPSETTYTVTVNACCRNNTYTDSTAVDQTKFTDRLAVELCKLTCPLEGANNGEAWIKIKDGCGPYTVTWTSGPTTCVQCKCVDTFNDPCGNLVHIDGIGAETPKDGEEQTILEVTVKDCLGVTATLAVPVFFDPLTDDLCVFDVRTIADEGDCRCNAPPTGRAELCLTATGSPLDLKEIRVTSYGTQSRFDQDFNELDKNTCVISDSYKCATADDVRLTANPEFGPVNDTPWEEFVLPQTDDSFTLFLQNQMETRPLDTFLTPEFALIKDCDDAYTVTITRQMTTCCPDGEQEVTFNCNDVNRSIPIWINIQDTCSGNCYRVMRNVFVLQSGGACDCVPLPGPTRPGGMIGKCNPDDAQPCEEPMVGPRRYVEIGCLRNGLHRVIVTDRIGRTATRFFVVGELLFGPKFPFQCPPQPEPEPEEPCAVPKSLVIGEPVIKQPTCTYNGSIGFEIESANYPVWATLHARGWKKTICLEAPVTSPDSDGDDGDDGDEECPPCEDVSRPVPTDITFLNLGPGCYTVELNDICDHHIEFPNLLLSVCKTPLEVDGQLEGRQYTVTYAGGNGQLLVFLSGPICRKWIFPSVDCEAGSVSQVLTNDDGTPLELEDGHYSLSVTDECNQNVTLHFKVPVDLQETAPNKGCCPDLGTKCCVKGTKGPFDVFLLKVDDC